MRILMLNYEYPPLGGGASNACYYLIRELSKQNIVIDLITSSVSTYKIEQFSENVTIFKLDVGKRDIHFWRIREIIVWTIKAWKLSHNLSKKYPYDLCHCWFGWPSGLIGYWFMKKIPYVVALRGSDVPGYNQRLKILDAVLFRSLSRLIWKHAKLVLANSEGLRQLALRTLKRNIEIIPNGVDVDDFTADSRRRKHLRLLCVSRLTRRKGIRYLIKAMADLNDVTLKIIGSGDQEKELKILVKNLHLKNRVTFLGYVSHGMIRKQYQDADVFVLPSLNEGMSNTVLEAMASGLALVVTDTGGTKELVKGNGIIIRKRSTKSIVEAIHRMNEDHELLDAFSKQSRKLAESMSWKKISKQYRGIYDEIE